MGKCITNEKIQWKIWKCLNKVFVQTKDVDVFCHFWNVTLSSLVLIHLQHNYELDLFYYNVVFLIFTYSSIIHVNKVNIAVFGYISEQN